MWVKPRLDRTALRKVIGKVVVIPTFSSAVFIIEWGITGLTLDRINRLHLVNSGLSSSVCFCTVILVCFSVRSSAIYLPLRNIQTLPWDILDANLILFAPKSLPTAANTGFQSSSQLYSFTILWHSLERMKGTGHALKVNIALSETRLLDQRCEFRLMLFILFVIFHYYSFILFKKCTIQSAFLFLLAYFTKFFFAKH